MNKAMVLNQYAFSRGYLSLLIDDIPEDRRTEQPGGVMNHPAWHLGHLCLTTDNFASLLGGQSTIDEKFKDLYAPGTSPSADQSVYPTLAELLKILDERRNTLAELLKNASEEQLNKPNPNQRAAPVMPTIGTFVLFGMLQHEFGHLNQLATWRAAAGLGQALKKFRSPGS